MVLDIKCHFKPYEINLPHPDSSVPGPTDHFSGLGHTIFYMAIIDEVNDEVDDSLEDYSEVLITRALAGEQLPSQSDGSNNSYYLITVTADYAEKQKRIRYSDEMVHIEAKGETEPARVLRTIFKDKDRQYYELTVSTPTIEKARLTGSYSDWMLLLYFSLLLLILFGEYLGLLPEYASLYVLLKWMDQYTIGKKPESSGFANQHHRVPEIK